MNKAFPRFPLVPIILFLCAWLGGVAPAFALPVQAVAVQSTPWSREARVLGTVESIGEVTLTSPVTGRVLGPFLQSGNVAAGAVVAHIAPPGLHAGILAAQARVAYARTQLERTQKLFQDGVMAQQNVDQAGLALAEARSALRALEAQSGDQVLTAPFAGTLHYLVPPGAVVNVGSPIARLAGRGEPWARAYVTPAQTQGLRVGTTVAIRAQGWQGQGLVRSVGQSARHLGLVSVYVTLPPDSPLLPGEWLQLLLPSAGGTAFRVPSLAVVMRGARSEVFVVRRGRAVAVAVEVVHTQGKDSWVTGALRAGDMVVISGNTRLDSGTPVEIRLSGSQP
ncbi:MAG: efflux RND transporter periplasmic adaptor subunit [Acidithiobacillus ferrooxidans]|uniref:Putative Efflux transporter, RND family, MFP subunit n=1 Tax=mine drainage metagenome TaxID=410659 RepID=E6QC65_9ZZZZ